MLSDVLGDAKNDELGRRGVATLKNDLERLEQPSALFALSSLFNHACAPNALWITFGDVIVIRARCSLAEGDEILIDRSSMSGGSRAASLQDRFPDGCTCERCEIDKLEGAEKLGLRSEALEAYPGLVMLSLTGRPARHSDTGRKIKDLIDRVQATYDHL